MRGSREKLRESAVILYLMGTGSLAAVCAVKVFAEKPADTAAIAFSLERLESQVEAIAADNLDNVRECKDLIVKLGLESAEDADDARLWERTKK